MIQGKKITIDPGHGGSEPGAVDDVNQSQGDSLRSVECELALDLAQRLGHLLREQGAITYLTRATSENVYKGAGWTLPKELKARADVANNSGSDLFISLHFNATGDPRVHGHEMWYHGSDARGKKLATMVYNEVLALNPELGKRGVHADTEMYQSGFGVLRNLKPSITGILVEVDFLTNPQAERWVNDKYQRQEVAMSIAKAVGLYFA